MGKILSIALIFTSELDLAESIPYLLSDALKNFYIPIGFKYGFNFNDKEPIAGSIGLDPDLIDSSNPLIQNEELIKEIYLTKIHEQNYSSKIIDFISKIKVERGPIYIAGNSNIYYETNSSIVKDWFFREMIVAESNIFGADIHSVKQYLTPILNIYVINYEKYRIIYFNSSSNVFLKKRFKRVSFHWTKKNDILNNDTAGELNWNDLIKSLYDFTDRFNPYLKKITFDLKGSFYLAERERLIKTIATLPKFYDCWR